MPKRWRWGDGPRSSYLALPLLCLVGGCAGQAPVMKTRVVSFTHQARARPRPLTRSVFKKPDNRENMSEEVIQRVINAPLEPTFPARAGVLVLDAPFSERTYTQLVPGDEAPQLLARSLEKSKHFVMVSDISPYLVKGQNIEALRELATRYRLRYLVVFNRRFVDHSHYNRWGWSWVSVVGIPFAPAYSLQTNGLFEATLMDVRTGTFLFTTQVHVEAYQQATPWNSEEKLAALQLEVARRASRKLSAKFLHKCRRLLKYVERERRRIDRDERKQAEPPPKVARSGGG